MFGGRFAIPSSRQASRSNDATTRLTVHFGSAVIDTTVTRDAAVADDWVRTVRAANPRGGGAPLIVGLDCEWKPNYRSWTTSKVAILQLCAGTRCLVLQLFYVDRIPASVRSFLADPGVLFVGIGVGEDVAKLDADYGFSCAAHLDLEGCCNDYLGRCTGGRRLGVHSTLHATAVCYSRRSKHPTTTSKVVRPSSSSAPATAASCSSSALRRRPGPMSCPRPREGSALVAVVFMALLFLQAEVVSCHPSLTVAAKHHHAVHVRKLLNNTTTGDSNSPGGAAAVAYAASVDLCSDEVVEVSQGNAGSLPNGIPSYSVTITNTCLDCTVCDVHVSCGEFASTELVDPNDFRRLSYGDCLVRNGGPIGPGETISFEYSNSFIYKMEVATVSCGNV